jgi:hypothetical protein
MGRRCLCLSRRNTSPRANLLSSPTFGEGEERKRPDNDVWPFYPLNAAKKRYDPVVLLCISLATRRFSRNGILEEFMARASTKSKRSRMRVSPRSPRKSSRRNKPAHQADVSKEAQRLMNSYSKYFAPPTENANEFKIVTMFDYTLPTIVTTHA